MASRIKPEIEVMFLAARRRGRVVRTLIWSPVIFAISSAVGVGFLLWRGHGVIHLLSKFNPANVSDNNVVWFWLIVLAIGLGVLGILAVFGMAVKDHGVVEIPYCPTCAEADETMAGKCEKCGSTLTESAKYVYPDIFDDEKIFRAFGLDK